MKLLFVHDHPFYSENGNIYSGGGLPQSIWKNYLEFFSEIVVFGRRSFNIKDKNIISSGDTRCTFVLTEQYTSVSKLAMNYQSLRKELEEQISKCDIVLLRLPSILGFVAYSTLKNSNKVLLVEQVGHAYQAYSKHGSKLGQLIAPLLHNLNKRIVSKANYVLYVTLQQLQRDYPTKGYAAGISDVQIPEILSVNQLREERFRGSEMHIGCTGGFDVSYKGQDILLKAVAHLPETVRSFIKIHLVGKGDSSWLTPIIKSLKLEENIVFIGSKKPGEEMFDYLEKLSMYVQPSFQEGMPRALLEAMSRGCPILGSKIGGIPDVVNEENLHKAGDYKSLAKQIEFYYRNREHLFQSAIRSITVVQPFLKSTLDPKRNSFFRKIISDLSN